jgi:hypothetical protein
MSILLLAVENAARILYTRIFATLRKQQFFSLEELNTSISSGTKALYFTTIIIFFIIF